MSQQAQVPGPGQPQQQPQQVIHNYIISRTLGQGTFGKVKLATHIPTNQQVAIKILNKQKIISMKMESKVEREIKLMKLFRHPHIINLYEVFETQTEIFLVLEYAPNGELFNYIVKRKSINIDECRRFFQQLVSALNYLHVKLSVSHRDLKPENLLLVNGRGYSSVKISDFGLSNLMSEGEFLKTSCGSPNYAAPEVCAGSAYIGPAADIWSAGCVLYTLLVGKLPFDDPYIPSLFKKIKNGEYSIPEFVDPMAADLIRGLLTVDVTRRFTIDRIRKHPWFVANLPKYLRINFDMDFYDIEEMLMQSTVGAEIEKRMATLGFNVLAVIRDMRNGEVNESVVCYRLIHDGLVDEILGELMGPDEMLAVGAGHASHGLGGGSVFGASDDPASSRESTGGSGPGSGPGTGAGAGAGGGLGTGTISPSSQGVLGEVLAAASDHEFADCKYETYATNIEDSTGSLGGSKVIGPNYVEARRDLRVEKKKLFYFGITVCSVGALLPHELMLRILQTCGEIGFKWRIGGILASKYYDQSLGQESVVLKVDNGRNKNQFFTALKLADPQTPLQRDLIIALTVYTACDHNSCCKYVLDLRKITGEMTLFLYYAQKITQAITDGIRDV